jgi:ABC-type sugar transport system substrate-binding protein
MNHKSLSAAAVFAAGVLALAGCAGSPAASPSSAGETGEIKSIFFANPLPSYPDWATADKCFRDATAKYGIDGKTSGPTGLSMDNQFVLDRITQSMAQQPDAIIMVPIVPAQYEPLMKQAKSKGIRVVTLNTGDMTSSQDFTIGTEYSKMGAKIAKEIGKREGQQNVGIISNAPGGAGDIIIKALEANLPENVKVPATAYDNGDPSKTADTVTAMVKAHPEINVVYSWEGTAVGGITAAIREQGLEGKVVGVVNDLTPQVQDGINDGTIYGTSKQDFCAMTTKTVENLVKLSKGEEVPANTDTGTTFVTKENLAEVLASEPAAK